MSTFHVTHGGTVTRQPSSPGIRRRLSGAALFVVALAAAFGAVFSAPPAQAVSTCTPDPQTACVQGIIKTSAGDPAAGVALTLDDGEQKTTSDADGRWVFPVTKAGSHTVAVDPATLPGGQFLKTAESREVTVELYESVSALFPLTDDPAATGSTSPEPEPDPAQPAETQPPTTTPGAETSAGTTASGDGFSWPRFWQQFASGIRMGLLLSLAAVGLSLVFGTTGLSNFAHAEMLSMGGILAFLFMGLTGNIWLAGGISVLIMAIFGWVQDKILWRPLRKRRLSLMQMMIVSIALSIVLQNVFQFFFGANVLRIDPSTPATVTLLGVTLTVQSYIAMGIALVAIVAVGLALKYSRFGRATRAVSDNPALAEASGIDVNRVIRIVWIASSALAGLAGVLLGLVLNGISWNTGWHFLLLLFAAVVLGGIGTAFGAVVGAMIIGLIVEMANIWLPGDLKHAAALFILIVVLLVRPQGIFGRAERVG
ncbi:branched-chain amino acid ABC transporter permease [Leucobacter luti]|nr:branched-chain amino acid ABC transporter permease [Leucobacter luti]